MTILNRSTYPTDLSVFFRYAIEAGMIESEANDENMAFDSLLLLSKVRALGHKILKANDNLSERPLVEKVLQRLPSHHPLLKDMSHLFCKAILESKHTVILCENMDESLLAPLTLKYRCTIEFGGIYYPSARHTFIAQMFSFKEDLKRQVAACPSDDLARFILIHKEQITPFWKGAKQDILRNVFHAKFGQNAWIKRALIATLNTHIVYEEQGRLSEGMCVGQILEEEREYQGGCLCSFDEAVPVEPSSTFCGKSMKTIYEEIQLMNECADEKMYEENTKVFRDPSLCFLTRCPNENYPFDSTLIKLENKTPINANFVMQSKYIATQAPLCHAEEDFWRMILEKGSRAIVMLNETTDYLCYDYYPKDIHHRRVAGKAIITLLEKERLITHHKWTLSPEADTPHGYIIRELQVEIEGKTSTTTHYQYLNWKDRDIGHSGCVLSLIDHIASSVKKTEAPITVHCAAGVGRTATFLVILDQVLQNREGNEINIPTCLSRLRSKEEGRYYRMVQSTKQYAFCYTTMQETLLA